MPNSVLTLNTVREYVRTELGGQVVDVELDQTSIDSCLNTAVRQYNLMRPRETFSAITVTSAIKKYNVSQGRPGLLSVKDVKFVSQTSTVSKVDPFNPIDQVFGTGPFTPSGNTTVGELDQMLNYVKDAAAVLGAEPRWNQQWEKDQGGNDVLYLYIDIIRTNLYCGFTWTSAYTANDDPVTGLSQIPNVDAQWILDFSVARAKQILGAVRGKFGGVAGPDGGMEPTDAAELKAEGRNDEAALLERLKRRRRPLGPLTG